jgi:hypothetical protein
MTQANIVAAGIALSNQSKFIMSCRSIGPSNLENVSLGIDAMGYTSPKY